MRIRKAILALGLMMFTGSLISDAQTETGLSTHAIEVLKSQLKDGKTNGEEEYDSHQYTSTDLEATLPIIKKILLANGVKLLSKADFASRVKSIFDRTIDISSQVHLFVNYNDACDRRQLYMKNGVALDGTFITKEGFFTDLYAIPELIDYQTAFPEYNKIEAAKIIKKEPDLGKEIEIPHWKDYKNLPSERIQNLKVLVARNKYLLNNSRTDFNWLFQNDFEFLKHLFLDFGYAGEKRIMKSVIGPPKNINSADDLKTFSKSLWHTRCNGKVVIHPKSLEVIKEFASPDRSGHIIGIAKCINAFFNVVNPPFKEMSFKNKAYVIAHLLQFGEQYKYNKAYHYGQMFSGNFIHYLDDKGTYRKEFENNSYYGLPNLKEWLKKAEKEKNVFKGIELADNPSPEDYLNMSRSGYTPNRIK
ncbi:hypothetical protein [Pedobacter caeni]|uniref:Uncharacterized protein n=1 Tax=Pedobacter caeni TaxID=288992 RepID=A0A1M4VEY9_9SPHI|nr:hypothetical protein [Pedobacter caeni]SHE67478.1 hypothetical protein SAMN04488522_101886 [Pedobacter caeni]